MFADPCRIVRDHVIARAVWLALRKGISLPAACPSPAQPAVMSIVSNEEASKDAAEGAEVRRRRANGLVGAQCVDVFLNSCRFRLARIRRPPRAQSAPCSPTRGGF